ncbi:MAG: rhomboid family intramembrane serine protease [Cellvibrionaceae bacterium]
MTKFLAGRIKLLSVLITVIVVVHIIKTLAIWPIEYLGVIPRSFERWYHIFTAPFIHNSHSHLINNLAGLSLLSALCLLKPIRFYCYASLFIIVSSGILVLLFGRPAIHIGASGWIFGLWGLLIALAWVDKSLKHFFMATVVLVFYGGMALGLLPLKNGVSFEYHIFGVLSGILYAVLHTKIKRLREIKHA